MRSLTVFLVCLFCFSVAVKAQEHRCTPDDANSVISFTIRNFGLNVKGTFKGIQGTIVMDPSNPASGQMDVSISASSINTGTAARDRHLRSDDYFDVAKHPRISITSTKISPGKDPGTYILNGKLTIRETTRSIEIPFTMKQSDGGLLFEGKFGLDRRDYKVGGNSISLSDDVTVYLKVFCK
jgi:polyisoprenoid-binding protein YceI